MNNTFSLTEHKAEIIKLFLGGVLLIAITDFSLSFGNPKVVFFNGATSSFQLGMIFRNNLYPNLFLKGIVLGLPTALLFYFAYLFLNPVLFFTIIPIANLLSIYSGLFLKTFDRNRIGFIVISIIWFLIVAVVSTYVIIDK